MDVSTTIVFPKIIMDEYSAAGTYQWTCPNAVYNIILRGCGGGGGGGAFTSVGWGGGGGAGAPLCEQIIAVTPGTTYDVVVGAGGNGGTTGGTASQNGSSSTFSVSGGATLATFPGGTGGLAASGTRNKFFYETDGLAGDRVPGAISTNGGASGGVGTIKTSAAADIATTTVTNNWLAQGQGGYTGGTPGTVSSNYKSGGGGAGPFGNGGNGATSGTGTAGGAGTGAGGGGGYHASTTQAGGAGGSGRMQIVYVQQT